MITFESGIDARCREAEKPTVARFNTGRGEYRYCVIGTQYGYWHTTGGDVRTWKTANGARRAAKRYTPLGGAFKPPNLELFEATLADQYHELFKTPAYELAAKRYTNGELAAKMTRGLLDGSANKDGEGIKRTCRILSIEHTYSAIREFLQS